MGHFAVMGLEMMLGVKISRNLRGPESVLCLDTFEVDDFIYSRIIL